MPSGDEHRRRGDERDEVIGAFGPHATQADEHFQRLEHPGACEGIPGDGGDGPPPGERAAGPAEYTGRALAADGLRLLDRAAGAAGAAAGAGIAGAGAGAAAAAGVSTVSRSRLASTIFGPMPDLLQLIDRLERAVLFAPGDDGPAFFGPTFCMTVASSAAVAVLMSSGAATEMVNHRPSRQPSSGGAGDGTVS